MNTYVCTPRGFVIEIYPHTGYVDYWDEPDGECRKVYNYCCRTAEVSERVRKPVALLPKREAPNIHIARVDFHADRVKAEVLADIKRMFAYAMSDRGALARRAARKR